MTYFVTLDTDGWITGTPATEQATDSSLTAVDIPVTSIQYFLRYPTKYRVVNGELQAPANLPNLDIDALRAIIDTQGQQIDSQATQITKQTANVDKLSTNLNTATAKIDAANQSLDLANESILELSDMLFDSSATTTATDTTATTGTSDTATTTDGGVK